MASYFERSCEIFFSWFYSLVISEEATIHTPGSHSLLSFDQPALPLRSWGSLPPFLDEKRLFTHIGFGWWLPLFLKQVTKQMACQALALGALWQRGDPCCMGHTTGSFSAGFQRPLKPMESAQGRAYFLQRLTLRLHYSLSLFHAQQAWKTLRNGRTARQKPQRTGRRKKGRDTSEIAWKKKEVGNRCKTKQNKTKKQLSGAVKADR